MEFYKLTQFKLFKPTDRPLSQTNQVWEKSTFRTITTRYAVKPTCKVGKRNVFKSCTSCREPLNATVHSVILPAKEQTHSTKLFFFLTAPAGPS